MLLSVSEPGQRLRLPRVREILPGGRLNPGPSKCISVALELQFPVPFCPSCKIMLAHVDSDDMLCRVGARAPMHSLTLLKPTITCS